MYTISKSKAIANLICPKRLWLQVNRPDLSPCVESPHIETGYRVGELAQTIFAQGEMHLIDTKQGFAQAFSLSKQLLETAKYTICEAGFTAQFLGNGELYNALAFADIMQPINNKTNTWHMIEVKASTTVKPYHQNDIAVQYVIAKQMGISIDKVSIAHIDSTWIYQGNNDYQGIFAVEDQTAWVKDHEQDAITWLHSAHETLQKSQEPQCHTGGQCTTPYECAYIEYCQEQENPNPPKQPATWLPRPNRALKEWIQQNPELNITDVPLGLLNPKQQTVQQCTRDGSSYHNHAACMQALSEAVLPYYFLDFETSNLAIPIFKGARPYQQIPFQWSAHILTQQSSSAISINDDYELEHKEFLDLSGTDPRRAFIEKLIHTCKQEGSIFVYNAAFEKRILAELKEITPNLSNQIDNLIGRIIDLLPIAREHYYHPDQRGSWSIKAILPTLSNFNYSQLDGVQHGGDAINAYQEAIHPDTSQQRKNQLQQQLSKYCEMDTLGMVWVWERLLRQ